MIGGRVPDIEEKNEYAVFETNGDDWSQLSIWTTKDRANQFLACTKPDSDSELVILSREK